MSKDYVTIGKRPEAFEPLRAEVCGPIGNSEMRILLLPGVGQVDGGVPCDIPMEIVPLELRVPNTSLWVELDEQLEVTRVWRREES